MNTQSTEIAEEINKIVTHLKTVKGWSQKQLSAQTEDLAKLKKGLTQVSTSQLSKALNYKEHNLSEGSLHKILKTLSVLQDYVQEDKPFSQHIVPQGKLRYLQGFYEMYHQSKEEQHLLKNIVEIQAESNTSGKVRIKPAHGKEIHVGRLEVFSRKLCQYYD